MEILKYRDSKTSEWKTVVAMKGENGKDGLTPVKGVDYNTEEDKQELVNRVLAALPVAEEVKY